MAAPVPIMAAEPVRIKLSERVAMGSGCLYKGGVAARINMLNGVRRSVPLYRDED